MKPGQGAWHRPDRARRHSTSGAGVRGFRDKEFFRPLPNGDAIRVRFDAECGAVIAFTAQYEVWAAGAWRPAVRYDSAHGRPHRDTLDWAGNVITKAWLPEGMGANEALTFAEGDMKAHGDRYRDEFLRRTS